MAAAFAWVSSLLAGGGLGAALFKMGLSVAFNAISAKLRGRSGPKPRDVQSEVRQSSAQRLQHFGRVRAGGVVLFEDWAQVGDKRVLFRLLAVSTGGIAGVDQWYLGDTPVTVDGQGVVQTAPWTGLVRLRLRTGRGSQYQGGQHPSLLAAFPSHWTPAHRGDGVATVLAEFDHVEGERIPDVYPQGAPEVTAVLRGVPLYDPATGQTAFSTNLPRQLRGFLVEVGGFYSHDDLDAASWTEAIADADAGIPDGAGSTIPRYHGGGSIALAEALHEVAARYLDAMAGSLFYTPEGKIGLRVGKSREPRYTIRQEHFVSSEIGPGNPRFSRATGLVASYVDPALHYRETTAAPWEDAAAVARYGETAPREVDLPLVQHHGHARLICKQMMDAENPGFTVTGRLRFWGLKLLGEDVAWYDDPEAGVPLSRVRISGYALDLDSGDGPVAVSLRAISPDAASITNAEVGPAPLQPTPVSHDPVTLPAPVITDLTVVTEDGQPVIHGVVPPVPEMTVQAQYRRAGTTAWLAAAVVAQTGAFRTGGLGDGRDYEVRARHIDPRRALSSIGLGESADPYQSAWVVVTGIHVIADQTAPSAPVVVGHTLDGDALTITWRPDLGTNYWCTRLLRGDSLAAAVPVDPPIYSTDSTITTVVTVGATATGWWLRSENRSGVTSAVTFVGTY